MTDGCLATLAILSEQLPAALGGLAPTEVAALEVLGAHAFAALAHHGDRIAVIGDVNLHRLSRKARIEGVIDQLHQSIRGRPVVSEKGGCKLWIDPLSHRYSARVPAHGASIREPPGGVK